MDSISIGKNIKPKLRKHKQTLIIKKPITPNINESLKAFTNDIHEF